MATTLALASCEQKQLSTEELQAAISEAVEKKELKTAVIYYRQLISQQDNAQNRIQLAHLYFNLFNHAAAIKEYLKARELGAGTGDWLVPLGVSWSTVGEAEKIISEFANVNSTYKDVKADAAAMIAWGLLKQQKVSEALEKLNQAKQLHPENQVASFVSADYLYKQGKLDQALTEVDKVTLNAFETEKILLKARLLTAKRSLTEAIELLSEGQERFPNDPRLLIRVTNLQIAANDFTAAEKNLDLIKQRFPNTLHQYLLEGKWLYIKKDDEKARDALQRAASISSQHPEVNMLLGLVNARLGRWDNAASHLNKTLQDYPEHLQSLLALSRVYLIGLNDPGASVALLESRQQQFTQSLAFQLHYIDALMANGQFTEALERTDAIQANNPQLSILNINRALARYRMGDTEQALTDLNEATLDADNSLTANILLTRIYLAEKKLPEADAQLSKIIQQNPDIPVIDELRASLMLAQGNRDGAKQELAKLVESSPLIKRNWLQLAGILIQSNDFNELSQLTADMAAQFGDDVDVLMLKIELAKTQQNVDEELSLMQQVWERDPSKILIGRQLINIHLAAKPFLAEQIARQLVSEHNSNALAHYDMGKVQLRIRKFNDAIESFNKAVAIDAELLAAHIAIIEAYKSTNQIGAAEGKFDQLRLKWPSNPLLIEQNIRFLISVDKLAEARGLISKVTEQATAAQLNAEIELADGNFPRAINQVKLARSLTDTNARVKLHSEILDASGDTVGALQILEEWLKENSDDYDIQLSLSDFRLKNSQMKSAYQGYLKLLDVYPDNLLLLNNMTWLLIEQNDRQALTYANRLRALSPEAPAFIDTMAWAEISLGDPNRGAAELEALLARNIQFLDAKYHLAVAFSKTGRAARAKAELEQIINTTGNQALRDKAKQLLNSL